MTILKPKRNNSYTSFIAITLIAIIVGGVLFISQYNAVAENRYRIKELKNEITKAEVANAEIKNELYQTVDPAKLEDMAETQGLVLEQSPDYMNINQWVSDSSY